MQVNWFPGHMYKTKKTIIERLKKIDIVVDLLDARAPFSSINPLINNLINNKLQIKILTKKDLADDFETKLWIKYFKEENIVVYAINTLSNPTLLRKQFLTTCKKISPNRNTYDKPLRILICGIPNVGKSVFVNAIVGKKQSKTGNEPGVTKQEERIIVDDNIWLYDTPGILWEKIENQETAMKLAMIGSIGINAYDEEEIAFELLDYLLKEYKVYLERRYGIYDKEESTDIINYYWVLIAKKSGSFKNNKIDNNKVAKFLLNEFRSGRIGKITLDKNRMD